MAKSVRRYLSAPRRPAFMSPTSWRSWASTVEARLRRLLIGSASPSRSSIPVHLARETDRLVHLIIRVDDERDLLQLLPRDGEADGRDLLVLRLDLALEAALQLIGSIDDDLRILVRAVFGADQDILGVVRLLGVVLDADRRDHGFAVGGLGTTISLRRLLGNRAGNIDHQPVVEFGNVVQFELLPLRHLRWCRGRGAWRRARTGN